MLGLNSVYIYICICIYMYTTSFDDPFLLPNLAVIKENSLSSIELLILMAMKISLPWIRNSYKYCVWWDKSVVGCARWRSQYWILTLSCEKLLFGSMKLLKISMISENIWVVGGFLMNNSPSNIFQKMLLLERYRQNSRSFFVVIWEWIGQDLLGVGIRARSRCVM